MDVCLGGELISLPAKKYLKTTSNLQLKTMIYFFYYLSLPVEMKMNSFP